MNFINKHLDAAVTSDVDDDNTVTGSTNNPMGNYSESAHDAALWFGIPFTTDQFYETNHHRHRANLHILSSFLFAQFAASQHYLVAKFHHHLPCNCSTGSCVADTVARQTLGRNHSLQQHRSPSHHLPSLDFLIQQSKMA